MQGKLYILELENYDGANALHYILDHQLIASMNVTQHEKARS